MSNQAEAMMQDQIEGAVSENESLRQENERLRADLKIMFSSKRCSAPRS